MAEALKIYATDGGFKFQIGAHGHHMIMSAEL
jgi:hypothetical protein